LSRPLIAGVGAVEIALVSNHREIDADDRRNLRGSASGSIGNPKAGVFEQRFRAKAQECRRSERVCGSAGNARIFQSADFNRSRRRAIGDPNAGVVVGVRGRKENLAANGGEALGIPA
jgi:hypothetical protein